MHVDRLTLPVSNVVMQYREDGKYLIAREERLPELYEAERRGLSIWTEPNYKAMTAFEEEFAGDVPHPTWWVISGTADPDTEIQVTFADDHVMGPFRPALAAGSEARVYRLGELWGCEWVSLPTTIYIHRSDDLRVPRIKFRRPNFLPPAPHPEVEVGEGC
ncbi:MULTISPECIES: hypothetical protein [Rhodococcus]|uniref:hypothetical protein n=1 Tax=Rhodococcus TaxID=1827 RepID=UPI000519F49F|nr:MULTISPECIES: hypothetical protein [Rhodococcus]AOD23267.1 hypothetical protein IM25_18145 [Rhodococcus sp. p52]KHJ71227.1 hypothetical protein QR64_18970 [Rhodococcus sp. Chr-9]UTM40126.1 hypothetical protein MX572_26115 [Rhodococcus pyridinivorans]